ncbi:MAG TPA: hypothetical protein VN026_11040 [Bacteroidia bacterium]|jgi:hypothetical protein|nr:hypothetical protein [Bacteroidia bacterium]
MKPFTFLLALLCFSLQSQTDHKVFEAKKIYFYGYDFSHFKFVEPSSIESSKIKDNINGWTTFVATAITDKKFKTFFDVDEAVLNWEVALNKSKSISADNIMGVSKTTLPKDSIGIWVNAYNFPDKEGVGLVVFVDCLYKPKKTSVITYVFVDLSNKKVLGKETFEDNEADGYGLIRFWGEGLENNIAKYARSFRKQKSSYNKTAGK